MAEREDTAEAPEAQAKPVPAKGALPVGRLLQPPDWRYQAARQYLTDAAKGRVPEAPSDAVVQYLVRGLRGMGGDLKDGSGMPAVRRYLFRYWPVLHEVIYFGTQARKSAVSAMMDTCLIRGWTHSEAMEAGCPVSAPVYGLYAKAFFDLSGVRAVHAWVQDFLIEPERCSSDSTLLRSRLLAYFGKGTEGTGAPVTGMLSDGEESVLKKIIRNERQKKLLDYVAKRTGLAPDVYAGIMEAALKTMTEQEFQTRLREKDDAGSSSLEELAANLESGIRAFSQQELRAHQADSLDFVNQYTKQLTGN